MDSWDHKSLTEDRYRKNTQNPSFSSSLLDEIYRSIDGGDEKSGEFKVLKEKIGKKQSIGNGGSGGGGGGGDRAKTSSTVEDEEMASLRRACLVEKWMEMKANEKVSSGRRRPPLLPEFDRRPVLDNDPLFFSSGSSSSDSSFGWFSEPEGFGDTKPKPSCFGPLSRRPKPVKTNVPSRSTAKTQPNEFYLFDGPSVDDHKTDEGGLIRSKARALKIYANLKKVKQPISPGGRLTTFLNSLLHGKKPKDSNPSVSEDRKTERKSKSTHGSTCSSASSFSRSCLSKRSPRSREKLNNGIPRSVRFYPVSVIVGEDSRPCGEKIISDKRDFVRFPLALASASQKNHNVGYEKKIEFLGRNMDEDDDMASDSSSDLFELDHLTDFKNDEYCEELPVYETTDFGTNRAISRGLIC